MSDIVTQLRNLVSLNNPEHGGPYQGTAAVACMEAMSQAADIIGYERALADDQHDVLLNWGDEGYDFVTERSRVLAHWREARR